MYTQTTLIAHIKNNILRDAATELGWGNTEYPGGDYDGIVEEIQTSLGVTDVALVPTTRLSLVNIHARKETWYAVMSAFVTEYDVGGTIRTLQRDQLFKHAEAMFKQAERDLEEYENIETRGTSRADIPPSTSIRIKLVY